MVGSAFTISAQNDIDALRYSQLEFGGTARFSSMAGSMGAIGGDFSTLGFNPAGIGVYRKSEFTVSVGMQGARTYSDYYGSATEDRKLDLHLNNLGLIGTIKRDSSKTGWRSFNFGIGYNRSTNYNTRSMVQGYNTQSSLLDTYVAAANGHNSADFDAFSTDLAWQTYLMNYDSAAAPNTYYHVIPRYGEMQKRAVNRSGSLGETSISFGGNYRDLILIGGSINIVSANYSEEMVFEERDEADSIANFKSFTLSQTLDTKGYGINFKAGVIVKPTDWLRIGAAVHTPTAFTFSDTYSSTMYSDLEGGVTYDFNSPLGAYDYNITTPFRAMGSLGFIIKKYGLINVDYEYVDYSDMHLNASNNTVFANVNADIRTKYQPAQNLRVGGEFRLDPVAFRVGYALYGSPFSSSEINKNATHSSYTGGIGFRAKKYVFDAAYVLTKYSDFNYLYDPNIVDPVKDDHVTSSFILTFGIRF